MHTALITGSYGGLGRCFCDIHARLGGNLILVGRNKEKLEAQRNELMDQYSIEVEVIEADLSQENAANKIYNICKENKWIIDILINNAGFGGQGDFTRERTMEEDMRMIMVDVVTPTKLCKLFLKDMVEQGYGKVLNVSSTAALMPGPLQAVYYASKAYMTSMSNALWRELKGTGVSVTALMPGAMDTGFAKTGGLSDTKLFSHAIEPMEVAKDGYEGMMKGELNVVSGLISWQKPMMKLSPLFPKKPMLDFVYDQQLVKK